MLDHGVDERGVFRQHYDTDALDASNLLIGLVRFLPPDDLIGADEALARGEPPMASVRPGGVLVDELQTRS